MRRLSRQQMIPLFRAALVLYRFFEGDPRNVIGRWVHRVQLDCTREFGWSTDSH